MEQQDEKRFDIASVDRKKAALLIAGLILAVMVVLLCITIGARANIQREYSSARDEIGEQLYTQLYMFCQTFDQVTVPGAEVQDVIIPDMDDYFLAAQTLNEALINAFGARYAALSAEDISAVENAFETYDIAFRSGKSTSDAQSSMQNCVERVRSILDTRFNDGILKAA